MTGSNIYGSTQRIEVTPLVTGSNMDQFISGTSGEVIFVGGANGSRIDRIIFQATGATTIGAIGFGVEYSPGSGTFYCVYSAPVVDTTPSTTVPAWSHVIDSKTHPELLPLLISAGGRIGATAFRSEPFNIITFGSDF